MAAVALTMKAQTILDRVVPLLAAIAVLVLGIALTRGACAG
jgi:hypothetical protein